MARVATVPCRTYAQPAMNVPHSCECVLLCNYNYLTLQVIARTAEQVRGRAGKV